MELNNENQVVVRINSDVALPDKNEWINRFEIKSATSNRVYVVAQHKTKRHWGCSCPGWITQRHCKHLRAIGLPANEKAFEPKVITEQ